MASSTGCAGPAKFTGDLLVAGDQTLATVDNEHQQIGASDRPLALFDDQCVKRILARAEQSAGIKQLERHALPGDRARQRIARRARYRSDDRATAAGDPVEKRGFPNVRTTDQDDGWAFARHSDVHLASALTA